MRQTSQGFVGESAEEVKIRRMQSEWLVEGKSQSRMKGGFITVVLASNRK